MKVKVNVDSCYDVSDSMVAREIEGQVIIVPLVSGVGNLNENIYTLNETSQRVWNYLDGKKSLADIIVKLANEYDAPLERIKNDVRDLIIDFMKKGMVVEIRKG
jgi:hypothetical protein